MSTIAADEVVVGMQVYLPADTPIPNVHMQEPQPAGIYTVTCLDIGDHLGEEVELDNGWWYSLDQIERAE